MKGRMKMSAKRKTKPTMTELEIIAGLYRLVQQHQEIFNDTLCGAFGECREGGCPLYDPESFRGNGCIWDEIANHPFMSSLECYLEENFNRNDPTLIEHDRPYLERY